MAKAMTDRQIYDFLCGLDWRGHIELPDYDLWWISEQLALRLAAKSDQHLCEACQEYKEIVVALGKAGFICEECLSSGYEQAEETRSLLGG